MQAKDELLAGALDLKLAMLSLFDVHCYVTYNVGQVYAKRYLMQKEAE